MKKLIWMLVLVFVCLALIVGPLVLHQHKKAETFKTHIRCQELATTYVNRLAKETNQTVTLVRVEYSPRRNSCIAAIYRTPEGSDGQLISADAETVDILTDEALYSGRCNFEDTGDHSFWCGNGRDVKILNEQTAALEVISTRW